MADSSKNKSRADKFKAIRNDLAELNARAWRDRRADFSYQFQPKPVQDPDLSSRLYGPGMKTVQWDPSSKQGNE